MYRTFLGHLLSKNLSQLLCTLVLVQCHLLFGDASKHEYRGKFTPDADYVLSGQLAMDLPDLPQVPFRFITDAEGFQSSRLSAVPEPGVHPRIILSPSDIELIRKRVQSLDSQGNVFKVSWRDAQNKATLEPGKQGYNGAPWAGISPIAARALVASLTDNDKMGREAAEMTVKHAEFLEPRVDILNEHPETETYRHNFYYWSRTGVIVGGISYLEAWREGGADRVRELAKKSVEFRTKDNQWSYTSLAFEYDYAYIFMTAGERDIVRRVLSKMSVGKYTTGMEIPGHFFINNHMSMGAMFLCVPLAIEGEEGYDPRILEQIAPRLQDKLTYDISPDGILYENVKGFIPLYAVWAVGRRGDRELLRHDHLKAMVESGFYNSANLYNRFVNHGRNRPGESKVELGKADQEKRYWEFLGAGGFPHAGFFWNWVMAYFYPDSPIIDFSYKTACVNQNYDKFDGSDNEKNYGGKIHYNMRSMTDVMLLCATEGLKNSEGDPIDYNASGMTPELKEKPMMWSDMSRGLAAMRSSWDEDAIYIHYENRSDYFYGGHETPEHGDFRLSADGVVWSPYTGAYMNPYFHNMVLIDGKAGVYQPVAGRMIGAYDSEAAATVVSDATDGYNWKKEEKNFYMWHEMIDSTPVHSDWLRYRGLDMNRDWELPFQTHMREFYDGFAHLDWGPWHGETRGPEYFHRWNDVERVMRTLHLARPDTSKDGKPYVLIIDDVKKDDKMHQFDWMLTLGGDVELYKAATATRNRHNTKSMKGAIGSDLIFCLADTKRKRSNIPFFGGQRPTVVSEPKEGDPMLLVRVLWRNTNSPYPLPSFEHSWKISHVRVSAYAVEPEFRVMLFPFRYGENLPLTTWSDDRSQLSVTIGGQEDVYSFDKTDAGRTVFSMVRNGKIVAQTPASPPSPKLALDEGWSIDKNDVDEIRKHHFADSFAVAFEAPLSGSEIRYQVRPLGENNSNRIEDYTKWELYSKPIIVTESSKVTAVTLKDHWVVAQNNVSAPTFLELVRQSPLPAVDVKGISPGLALEVYETRSTIFDDRGFFTGKKNMLPDLSRLKPIASGAVDGFTVPRVYPTQPRSEMAKGFYRYRGFFKAEESGVYRFKIFSPSPIDFKLSADTVLSVTGPYGASQKNRYGEVSLAAGLHPIDLVVCDPVFWKGAMEAPMTLNVEVMSPNANTYSAIAPADLSRTASQLAAFASPEIPVIAPVHVSEALVPGWVENRYDWAANLPEECILKGGHNNVDFRMPVNGLPENYFEPLVGAEPFAREIATTLNGNDYLGRVITYQGYFKARWKGVYSFRLDATGANELLIDGKPIVRNRMNAPELFGQVELEPGYYPITIRLAEGSGICEVKAPGHEAFAPLVAGDVYRPENITRITDQDRLAASVVIGANGEAVSVEGYGSVNIKTSNTSVVGGKSGGKALEMNGPHSYVELQGLNLPDDVVTVSIWFKVGKGGRLMEGMPNKFMADFRGKDNIRTLFYRDYADSLTVSAGEGFLKQQWTLYTAILDKNSIRVFINGEFKGHSSVDRNGFYSKSTDARPTAIQFMTGNVGGVLGKVEVYNRALTEVEIGQQRF
ncbi:LamG-like jellyroll fold domain-containing protein [Rubellicoccus peritrichatus]|uniref:LamG-like jellyroll fold domain-containing protein n=1 Tax=Rubellicoccus peritrichatus TaxID=3080537 RepID=A0AAQ3L5G5_9BACT|nr:LamG-like jellyroll fold domain-containing protein [Puniceicoccus sp. CR14]WOO39779.1 LamG-like jellyroll fold domain-containing protein [Puniceicoccus sp. CR14]